MVAGEGTEISQRVACAGAVPFPISRTKHLFPRFGAEQVSAHDRTSYDLDIIMHDILIISAALRGISLGR
jgi:hypothetical protein